MDVTLNGRSIRYLVDRALDGKLGLVDTATQKVNAILKGIIKYLARSDTYQI